MANNKNNKNNKNNEKEQEQSSLMSAEAIFMVFALAIFILGSPITLGVAGLGLSIFLGKKIYDKVKENKQAKQKELSPKDITKAFVNAIKKAHPGKDIDLKQILDLAYGKDGKELSMKDFKTKVDNIAKDFVKSKDGQKLMNNPKTKEAIEKSMGKEGVEVANNIQKEANKELENTKLENTQNSKEESKKLMDIPDEHIESISSNHVEEVNNSDLNKQEVKKENELSTDEKVNKEEEGLSINSVC